MTFRIYFLIMQGKIFARSILLSVRKTTFILEIVISLVRNIKGVGTKNVLLTV